MRPNKFLLFVVFALALIAGGVMLQKVYAQGITLNDLFFPHSQSNFPKINEELSNPLINQPNTSDREGISSSPAFVESSNNQIVINIL